MDVTLPRILTPREWFAECLEMCKRKMFVRKEVVDLETEIDVEVVAAASGSAAAASGSAAPVEHVERKMPISRKDVVVKETVEAVGATSPKAIAIDYHTLAPIRTARASAAESRASSGEDELRPKAKWAKGQMGPKAKWGDIARPVTPRPKARVM